MLYKENKISVNDFNYFLSRRNKLWSKLKVYLNNKKLVDLERNEEPITSFVPFFSRGKFLIFILLNRTIGLKILCRFGKMDPHESLKKIIKIQKILYKNGVSFDCQDVILEIPITEIESNTQRIFLGYITDTDINFKRQKIQYDLNNISNEVLNICKKNYISRQRLSRETIKYNNYVFTNKNKYKFIDIDPKFHLKANGTITQK